MKYLHLLLFWSFGFLRFRNWQQHVWVARRRLVIWTSPPALLCCLSFDLISSAVTELRVWINLDLGILLATSDLIHNIERPTRERGERDYSLLISFALSEKKHLVPMYLFNEPFKVSKLIQDFSFRLKPDNGTDKHQDYKCSSDSDLEVDMLFGFRQQLQPLSLSDLHTTDCVWDKVWCYQKKNLQAMCQGLSDLHNVRGILALLTSERQESRICWSRWRQTRPPSYRNIKDIWQIFDALTFSDLSRN